MSPVPHAVIPLPTQGSKSYKWSAHYCKELLKVVANMNKATPTGKNEVERKKEKKKRNSALKRCSSPEEPPQLEARAKRQLGLQGAKRRQNFQHSTHTALQVCSPTRGIALPQQTAMWPPLHAPPLPHWNALMVPDCQSCDLPQTKFDNYSFHYCFSDTKLSSLLVQDPSSALSAGISPPTIPKSGV